MIKQIVALDRDGLNVRTHVYSFKVATADFDLCAAVKKAVGAFLRTEEGKGIYLHNCEAFNWGDFDLYVPNDICVQFGFLKVGDTVVSSEEVDFNEELAEKFEEF